MRLISSLSNRIFLATTLLAVAPIGVATYVVNATVTRQAEAELERGIAEAGRLVDEYRTMLFEHFTREARLIADLPRFKAAVELDHEPTVRPLAADYRQQIDADLFLVTSREGRVLADLGDSGLSPAAVAALPAVRAGIAGRESASFWPHESGVLQVATVPIWIDPEQPEMLGSLSVGFSLNERLAARFRQLTNSEIAFAHEGRIQASTVPGVDIRLVGDLLGDGRPARVMLDGDEYVALARPLGAAGAMAAEVPVAVILRSRSERLRFLGPLHTALAATALLAVLAAVLLSYGVARTVTRPLGAITAAMRETAATGELTRSIPPPAGVWVDEDARLLASTFNAMTESIGRFQREAGQRERLSSLGRLSTVIAHEIRNPLMIVKTALRSLRRAEADPDRVRRAAADIEEEVARLDRIVTEVLDFARPIRFELAPADINAICRDAADACAAEAGGPPIHVVADPNAGILVTDRERLRLALINVLANAGQAVASRERLAAPVGGAGATGRVPGPPPVELRTARLDSGRILIAVRDRGPGIAPEDLPRIFEPFFTTRRTGSGVGLAIVKNVVEGLGGTIRVNSRPDAGTEVRIEL